MPEPKPPLVDPKREGGLKSPSQTLPAEPQETGMVVEGDPSPKPRDERPGGMIGEG